MSCDRGMKSATRAAPSRNFHLPLPADLYDELRAEAERRGEAATTLARAALAEWLQARRRLAVAEAVTAYATTTAGSTDDLNPEVEAAGLAAIDPGTRP